MMSFPSSASPLFVIGVDGGGTKTAAVLLSTTKAFTSRNNDNITKEIVKEEQYDDENQNFPTSFITGSSNWNSVGDEVAKRNLFDAMDGVLLAAIEKDDTTTDDEKRLTAASSILKKRSRICHLCLGLACIDTPTDKEKLLKWLLEEYFVAVINSSSSSSSSAVSPPPILIFGDAVIALATGDEALISSSSKSAIIPGSTTMTSTACNADDDNNNIITTHKNVLLHGITVIAGTGVIGYGRNAFSKKESRLAGWGPILGDQGSGYDIGLETLKLVMQRYDGRDKNITHYTTTKNDYNAAEKPSSASASGSTSSSSLTLTQLVLHRLGLNCEEDLLGWAYGNNGGDQQTWDKIASIAPCCFEAAEKLGDKDANKILQSRAEIIAGLIRTLIRKLAFDENHADDAQNHQNFSIVLSGGIATSDYMFGLVCEDLLLKKEDFRPNNLIITKPKVRPEVAAALLAVQLSKSDYESIRLL